MREGAQEVSGWRWMPRRETGLLSSQLHGCRSLEEVLSGSLAGLAPQCREVSRYLAQGVKKVEGSCRRMPGRPREMARSGRSKVTGKREAPWATGRVVAGDRFRLGLRGVGCGMEGVTRRGAGRTAWRGASKASGSNCLSYGSKALLFSQHFDTEHTLLLAATMLYSVSYL